MPSDKVFTYTFYWIKLTASVVKLCTKLARSHVTCCWMKVLFCPVYSTNLYNVPQCEVCSLCGIHVCGKSQMRQSQERGSTAGRGDDNGITAKWLLRICHLFVYSMSVYTFLPQLSLFKVACACGSSSIVWHRTCTLHPAHCGFFQI